MSLLWREHTEIIPGDDGDDHTLVVIRVHRLKNEIDLHVAAIPADEERAAAMGHFDT